MNNPHLVPPQPTAQQHGRDDGVAQPLQGGGVLGLEELRRLVGGEPVAARALLLFKAFTRH